ncbi:MAG: alpha-glucan family phosphorylase [Nanoarchaeota archaeon]|nr:alpha-glucan family phosphorylase [Nanoarchaeota archaeon]
MNTVPTCRHLIAYFSMEIGFRNEIPTYSGGLGILAGDTLKAIADMGVDVVGITLLSEKGYFYQEIDDSGYQHEKDYNWTVDSLLTKTDLEIVVPIADRQVYVSVWKYELKGVNDKSITLYFLDADNEKNSEIDRQLTAHLYGGDNLYRLQQEIILGIGGVRLLRRMGLNPLKYHMNEGHAAFLTLELLRELTSIDSFEDKQNVVKSLCSFTTHTPVAAGHDSFDPQIVRKYLGDLVPNELFDEACRDGKFSMTRLALNCSCYVNAVARKHQEVSSQMFPEFKIDYITNGIHTLTWVNKRLAALFDKHVVDWRKNPLELRNAKKIPLSEIFASHQKAKEELIDYVNTTTNSGLEYDVFTIGFARRATAYKRADLLFRDIDRLKRISQKIGKIQLVFAGKAHPHDELGKQIIKHIISLKKVLDPAIKLVFLENYNMYVAQLMTGGVDLWLNTPKRPLEASGTSGMKAAANGVPSLSVPDGWWVEGLIEGVTGWGIGPEALAESDERKIDQADANELYKKLEENIIPLYYKNPDGYAEVMRNAICINGSYFNTHRMAKQYLVRAYTRNA